MTSATFLTKCPTCHGNVVEVWMPTRFYDAMVWLFALQGFLDSSDTEKYLEMRRAIAGEDNPTEEERGSIMNITNEINKELKLQS